MEFQVVGSNELIAFKPRAVVIAGYTGKDRAAVDRHIHELAAAGIPPPSSVPAFYVLDSDLLTDEPSIVAPTAETSGEVEPVLICRSGGWYLTVGSDHTARDLERISIEEGKRTCPKPISRQVWPFDVAQAQWSNLVLRSWVRQNGEQRLYQEAPVTELLPIAEILRAFEQTTGQTTDDIVMFLGTVPLRTGRFVFSDRYELELVNPSTGQALRYSYQVSLAKDNAHR